MNTIMSINAVISRYQPMAARALLPACTSEGATIRAVTALAMAADWTVRAVLFLMRQRGGKWKEFRVIK